MAEDKFEPKGGSSGPTYPGGKFGWDPICGPKQTESSDGILSPTGSTLPAGAAKPKK